MERLDVLALVTYGPPSPATRIRVDQYRPLAEREGIDISIDALIPSDRVQRTYQQPVALRLAGLFVGLTRRLIRLIRETPDLVLIQREASPALGGLVVLVLRLRHIPFVYDFDDAVYLDQPGESKLARALRRPLGSTRRLCRRAAIVTAGNTDLGSFAASSGAQEVVVVPSVVTAAPPIGVGPASAHAPAGGLTIGWIGTHSTFPYLEAALPELLAHPGVTRVIVVCNRTDRVISGLRKWDRRLDFREWSEQAEQSALAEMDMGVYPLPDDPWTRGKCGFKAIQYMAAGVPVLANPVGAIASIVNDGVTGLHIDGEGTWSAAIERIVDDPGLLKRMGAAGSADVARQYTTEIAWPTLASVLRRAADA